ncbi:DUF4232 domain-containing protein [Streptomyces sp. 8N114]|uniref:DUF4232 domain-containing protein n=1 Tax=Streptomyces sp. 8N114 TaxID=3457419 RepID=UPI003FD4136A
MTRVGAVRKQQQDAAPATGRFEGTGGARRRVDGGMGLAAVAAVGLAAVLLTGCGKEAGASGPKKVAGEAAPVPGDSPGDISRKKSASPSSSSRSDGGDSKDDKGPPASSEDNDAGSSGATGGGSGPGAPGLSSCKTSELAFSTSSGMAEGSLLVNLKNVGSATCTLKGFPGADLRSEDGSLNASRGNGAPPTVSVDPGEATRFTLRYPPNDSGGSGVTMTSLVVTPPNETQSRTLPVSINLPVDNPDSPTSSRITVSPVGAGQ